MGWLGGPELPARHEAGWPSYSDLTRFSDNDLMAQLQVGCHDALAVLFDRYHRLVLSIALRIIHDPGESEDVMQGVFLEIYKAVGQFDPAKGTTKVWILQYAYHRAINRRQYLNSRRFYTQENVGELQLAATGLISTHSNLTVDELRVVLRKGLATLSAPQRRVIELASFDGFSMKEIAEETGEPLYNVRHHYYRGLEKLRSFLTGSAKTKAASAGE